MTTLDSSQKREVLKGKIGALDNELKNYMEVKQNTFQLTMLQNQDLPDVAKPVGKITSALIDDLYQESNQFLTGAINHLRRSKKIKSISKNGTPIDIINTLRQAQINSSDLLVRQRATTVIEPIPNNQHLKELYEMRQIFGITKHEQTDEKEYLRKLFVSLVNKSDSAFLEYKESDNIRRALLKRQFLQQPKRKNQLLVEKIIKRLNDGKVRNLLNSQSTVTEPELDLIYFNQADSSVKREDSEDYSVITSVMENSENSKSSRCSERSNKLPAITPSRIFDPTKANSLMPTSPILKSPRSSIHESLVTIPTRSMRVKQDLAKVHARFNQRYSKNTDIEPLVRRQVNDSSQLNRKSRLGLNPFRGSQLLDIESSQLINKSLKLAMSPQLKRSVINESQQSYRFTPMNKYRNLNFFSVLDEPLLQPRKKLKRHEILGDISFEKLKCHSIIKQIETERGCGTSHISQIHRINQNFTEKQMEQQLRISHALDHVGRLDELNQNSPQVLKFIFTNEKITLTDDTVTMMDVMADHQQQKQDLAYHRDMEKRMRQVAATNQFKYLRKA